MDVTSEKTPLVVGKSYIVNKFLREGETGVRIHNNSEVIRTFSDSTTTTNLTTSPSVLTGLCRFLVTEDCGNQSLAGRYSASGRVTKVINNLSLPAIEPRGHSSKFTHYAGLKNP